MNIADPMALLFVLFFFISQMCSLLLILLQLFFVHVVDCFFSGVLCTCVTLSLDLMFDFNQEE